MGLPALLDEVEETFESQLERVPDIKRRLPEMIEIGHTKFVPEYLEGGVASEPLALREINHYDPNDPADYVI